MTSHRKYSPKAGLLEDTSIRRRSRVVPYGMAYMTVFDETTTAVEFYRRLIPADTSENFKTGNIVLKPVISINEIFAAPEFVQRVAAVKKTSRMTIPGRREDSFFWILDCTHTLFRAGIRDTVFFFSESEHTTRGSEISAYSR
jgi:hypothetical protein